MYNKRIVCDIDDTISFCTDRDWENAKTDLSFDRLLNLGFGARSVRYFK